jgi:hypothetical protein
MKSIWKTSAEKRESSDGDFVVNDRINKNKNNGDCDFSKKHQHPIPNFICAPQHWRQAFSQAKTGARARQYCGN